MALLAGYKCIRNQCLLTCASRYFLYLLALTVLNTYMDCYGLEMRIPPGDRFVQYRFILFDSTDAFWSCVSDIIPIVISRHAPGKPKNASSTLTRVRIVYGGVTTYLDKSTSLDNITQSRWRACKAGLLDQVSC